MFCEAWLVQVRTGPPASPTSLLPGGIARDSWRSSSVCLTLETKACGHDPPPHTILVTMVNWQEYPSAEVCHFYMYLFYLCLSFGPDGFLRFSQLTLHCPGFLAVLSEVGGSTPNHSQAAQLYLLRLSPQFSSLQCI